MKNRNALIMVVALRLAIVLLVEVDILSGHTLSNTTKLLFAAGILLIQANDYWRHRYHLLSRNRGLYYLSMSTSIVGISLYMYQFNSSAASVYYIFPLIELFLTSGVFPMSMLALHVLVYVWTLTTLQVGLEEGLFTYLAILLVVYLFRQNNLEKEKVQQLNSQLKEANVQLLTYSEDLKEMAIVKERTRIAQELHDSIGHGLVSLRMHLEFAENTLYSSPLKSKEALNKAQGIMQNSMLDLRKAVAILHEDIWNSNISLEKLLNELAQSIQLSGRIQCSLIFDDHVEQAITSIKKGIFKTVREAITNGVKHGSPQTFQIEVTRCESIIRVVVNDDGTGCSHIQKSHGLRGIEKRIEEIKGTVRFRSEKNRGFTVLAEIPYVTSAESL
ncbi:sensor histidine kinase [Brevibacillus ginsengisoli]|uniref:sensor histidine kinase n=1 Tax=Brevibacillus ginsengisoli TaxID=363854 RepID=UPI003CF23DA5